MAARRNRTRTDRFDAALACPVRKRPPRGYGAFYNFMNDDGGVRWSGLPIPAPTIRRRMPVRGLSQPLVRPAAPSRSRTIGVKVISSTWRVLSVPATGGPATHDTQNQAEITPSSYPAFAQDYGQFTAVAW